MKRCVFNGNTGGAFYGRGIRWFENCLFINNSNGAHSTTVWLEGELDEDGNFDGWATLINCTIVNNGAWSVLGWDTTEVNLRNLIVYGNRAPVISVEGERKVAVFHRDTRAREGTAGALLLDLHGEGLSRCDVELDRSSPLRIPGSAQA